MKSGSGIEADRSSPDFASPHPGYGIRPDRDEAGLIHRRIHLTKVEF
jgi:hypothetical protein